jgi:hypothetical protein
MPRFARHGLRIVCVWVAVVGLIGALPSRSRAEPVRGSISTTIDSCVPIDPSQFQRLLAIELGPAFDNSTDPRNRVASVMLTCIADGIQVHVDDAVTRKSMTRVVDLTHVPAKSRSRLMALAVAEFLTASWLELRLFGDPPVEPVGPKLPNAAIQTVTHRVELAPIVPSSADAFSAVQLGATFDLAMFSSAPRPIPCLALRMGYTFRGGLALQLGAQVGQADIPGTLDIGSGPEHVDIHLTMASLHVSLLYTANLADFDLYIGAGVRVGFVYLKGAPLLTSEFSPQGSYSSWVVPMGVLGLQYRVASHLRIISGLEIGGVSAGSNVVADGQSVARLKGVWGCASLGLAWSS